MVRTALVFVLGSLCVSQVAKGSSVSRKIDGTHSTVTVRVYKSASFQLLATIMKSRRRLSPGRWVKESDTPSVELRVATVRKNGTPVWYLMAKDEGHGFNKKSNQEFQFYATVLFIQRYLLK